MSTGGGRKGRRLSPEDIAVWDGVAKSVRPLRKRARLAAPDAVSDEATPAPPAPKASKRAAPPASPLPAAKPAPAPLSLDRKARQKIARGRDSIDARLDLHGHTQAEAHAALLRFLTRTRAKGGRVALVITGKGGRGDGGGVLKRAVPLWLALPDFRAMVIGFDAASAGHGGEGALYVRLRKMRE